MTRKSTLGREPWSSGYEQELYSRAHGFESEVLGGSLTCCKIALKIDKTVNKRKRGRGYAGDQCTQL